MKNFHLNRLFALITRLFNLWCITSFINILKVNAYFRFSKNLNFLYSTVSMIFAWVTVFWLYPKKVPVSSPCLMIFPIPRVWRVFCVKAVHKRSKWYISCTTSQIYQHKCSKCKFCWFFRAYGNVQGVTEQINIELKFLLWIWARTEIQGIKNVH